MVPVETGQREGADSEETEGERGQTGPEETPAGEPHPGAGGQVSGLGTEAAAGEAGQVGRAGPPASPRGGSLVRGISSHASLRCGLISARWPPPVCGTP